MYCIDIYGVIFHLETLLKKVPLLLNIYYSFGKEITIFNILIYVLVYNIHIFSDLLCSTSEW